MLLLEGEPEKKKNKLRRNQKLGYFSRFVSYEDKVLLSLIAAGMTHVLVSLYVVLIRGFGSWWYPGLQNSYEEVFKTNFGMHSRITQPIDITSMVQNTISHHYHVEAFSKLGASGFWTSLSIVGPTIHLLGVICMLPTWYTIAMFIIKPKSTVIQLHFILPLNIVPILLCNGIPSLHVAAAIGLISIAYKVYA